jgi:hypothetical protein
LDRRRDPSRRGPRDGLRRPVGGHARAFAVPEARADDWQEKTEFWRLKSKTRRLQLFTEAFHLANRAFAHQPRKNSMLHFKASNLLAAMVPPSRSDRGHDYGRPFASRRVWDRHTGGDSRRGARALWNYRGCPAARDHAEPYPPPARLCARDEAHMGRMGARHGLLRHGGTGHRTGPQRVHRAFRFDRSQHAGAGRLAAEASGRDDSDPDWAVLYR